MDVQVHGSAHGQQLQGLLEEGKAGEADQDGEGKQEDDLQPALIQAAGSGSMVWSLHSSARQAQQVALQGR